MLICLGVNSAENFPKPNCPKSPAPQVKTFPKPERQTVCLNPQDIDTIFSPEAFNLLINVGKLLCS